MKRKIEIIFETEEQVLYKDGGGLRVFCPNCNSLVEIRSTENPTDLSELIGNELLNLNENQEIHAIEAEQIHVGRNAFKKWMNFLKNKLWKILAGFPKILRVNKRTKKLDMMTTFGHRKYFYW